MRRFLFTVLISLVLLSFVSFCGQRVTQEQLKAQAEQFEREEKFDQAVKTYEKLVAQYPKGKFSDGALYKIGILYSNNLRDFQKSVAAYIKLVESYPQSNYAAQAQFMIGYIYANDIKDFDKARNAYNVFLEKYPQNELVPSVQWELNHLGKDISEIEFVADTTKVVEKKQRTRK